MNGHDELWSSDPDPNYLCVVCTLVARDAIAHVACGKLFCELCWTETAQAPPCPAEDCPAAASSTVREATDARAAISALPCVCLTCEAIFPVGDKADHVCPPPDEVPTALNSETDPSVQPSLAVVQHFSQ